MAANSEFSVTATGLKPLGIFVSLSPWEFQTCSGLAVVEERAGLFLHGERALAILALLTFLDLAAEELREQLHAVADAENRHAQRENVFVRHGRVPPHTRWRGRRTG